MLSLKRPRPPKTHKKKRKRQLKNKLKTYISRETLPGVTKIKLSETSQKILGIVAGHDVSVENPWKFVKKEVILDNINLYKGSSELLLVHEEVKEYPEEEVLMGYVIEDWFQLVHSVETKEYIMEENKREQKELEENVSREIRRPVGKWETLGSEIEIDESLVKQRRPLIEINLKIPKVRSSRNLSFRNVKDVKDGYIELLSEKPVETVERVRIDRASQNCPKVVSTSVQTMKRTQKNINTQYEYEIPKPKTPQSKYRSSQLLEQQPATVSDTNIKLLTDAIWANGHHDIHVDDYANLVKNPTMRLNAFPKFQMLRCYMCPEVIKNNIVAQISWDNFTSGLLAVCYNKMPLTAKKRSGALENEIKEDTDPCPVLVWSYDESFDPVLTLEASRTVTRLSFSPYKRCLLVGGCANGQILVWDFLKDLGRKPEWIMTNFKYVEMFKTMTSKIVSAVPKSIKPIFTSDFKTTHNGLISGISWLPHDLVMKRTGKLERKTFNEDTTQFLTFSFDGILMVWNLKKKSIFEMKKKARLLPTQSSPIEVTLIHKIIVNVPLLTHARKFSMLEYDEISPNCDPTVQSLFKISDPQPPSTKYPFIFTSTTGDMFEISWSGRDFDAGQKIPTEKASLTHFTAVHDAPIAHCSVHTSFPEAVLTVGGTVCALWHVTFPQPLTWRKSSHHGCHYICGGFSVYNSLYFILVRSDGVLELWDLLNLNYPVKEMHIDANTIMMAGGFFTAAHCRKNTFALSDSLGTLLILRIPESLLGTCSNEEEAREIFTNLLDYKIYVSDRISKLQKVSEPKEENEEIPPEEFAAKVEDAIVEKKSQFVDEKYMRKTLLARKNLKINEMEKFRKPLAELYVEGVQREERRAKAVSYKAKVSSQVLSKIFQGIVSPPRHVDYNRYSMTSAKNLNKYVVEKVDEYADLESRILDFVDTNTYEREFNWNNYVEKGKKRKWWKGF